MGSDEDKKRFRRLVLSSIDIGQALSWARHIKDKRLWDEANHLEAKIVGRALQTAMIVAYVRPFSGNTESSDTKQRPGLSLDTKLDPKEWKLHQDIQEQRHKVFAHSDSEVRDLKISVREWENQTSVFPLSHNPYVMKSAEELDRFISLAEKVRALIFEEMTTIQSKLIGGDRF